MPEHGWTCFHCGETFKTVKSARDHFGFGPDCDPACRIKAGAEGSLLRAIRALEAENQQLMDRVQSESTEGVLAHHAAIARHTVQLRLAEELGYERGLADGRGHAVSFWRARARRLIAELTCDLPETATLAERRKALWGQGYPAHEGTNWGRRMWGSEVRKYLAQHGDSSGRVSGKPVQWPADIHFPFADQGSAK